MRSRTAHSLREIPIANVRLLLGEPYPCIELGQPKGNRKVHVWLSIDSTVPVGVYPSFAHPRRPVRCPCPSSYLARKRKREKTGWWQSSPFKSLRIFEGKTHSDRTRLALLEYLSCFSSTSSGKVVMGRRSSISLLSVATALLKKPHAGLVHPGFRFMSIHFSISLCFLVVVRRHK